MSARPSMPSWFTGDRRPGRAAASTTLDPAAIGAALGLASVAPFTLVALGPAPTPPRARRSALPRPPNDHLSYALTWFGLAACLLVVFVVYVRKALRS